MSVGTSDERRTPNRLGLRFLLMRQIEVARSGALKAGDSTQGIVRERAFEDEDVVVSQSRVAPRVVSGWHHHGARRLYGYVVSGRLRLEYGPEGTEAVEATAGDFFRIPRNVVHRDVNPDEGQEALIVNILVGGGPSVVNVSSPNG